MKNVAIIVAGGFGRRFKSRLPKQYLKINNKEILAYSIEIFEKEKFIEAILIVVAENYIDYIWENIIKKYKYKKVIDVIKGGSERYFSVLNGILYLKKYNPLNVLIHDGVRPYISKGLIKKILNNLKKEVAVIPVVKINSTVKEIKNSYIVKTIDRNKLRFSVTPQGFRYNEILNLYTKENIKNLKPTDEAFIFEYFGKKVKVIEEDEKNIKITTKNDFEYMKSILKEGDMK